MPILAAEHASAAWVIDPKAMMQKRTFEFANLMMRVAMNSWIGTIALYSPVSHVFVPERRRYKQDDGTGTVTYSAPKIGSEAYSQGPIARAAGLSKFATV